MSETKKNWENGFGKSPSLDDTLDRMIDSSIGAKSETTATASASLERDGPDFIPSKTWQGSKRGYYFGTSKQHGTGYHWDQKVTANQDATLKKRKRGVRIAEEKNKVRILPPTGDELLKEAEEASQNTRVLELTRRGMQQATTLLEKAVNKNALERAQHADSPENYMESELALHEQISSLKAVAASPDLYPNLVEAVETLFPNILTHENSDIALALINVLVEWLDPELIAESSKGPKDFQDMASAAVTHSLDLVVNNLGRLQTSEDEDSAGVEDILTLVESLLDLDSVLGGVLLNGDDGASVASHILRETRFLSWLLPQATDADSPVQSRAAEVMALLLQHEDAPACIPDVGQLAPYQSAFEEENANTKTIDGMELLLQSIAVYRKRQPETEAKCETLENNALALASLLFAPQNVQRFLDAQGIELVLRCLKEKVHAGWATLKTLDFYGSDPVYVKASEHLVDVGGLKYIFPIFMGRSIPKPAPCSDAGRSMNNKKSKKAQRARREWLHSLEENSIRIIYSLTRHISDSSPNDAKERLLVKFLEADCEKCDRLVELCLLYDERARGSLYNFYKSGVEEDMEEDEVELAGLNAKLRGGGDLFHRAGAIAGFASVGSKRCHEHILSQLSLQNSGIGVIKAALQEFASVLGDNEQEEKLKKYMSQL